MNRLTMPVRRLCDKCLISSSSIGDSYHCTTRRRPKARLTSFLLLMGQSSAHSALRGCLDILNGGRRVRNPGCGTNAEWFHWPFVVEAERPESGRCGIAFADSRLNHANPRSRAEARRASSRLLASTSLHVLRDCCTFTAFDTVFWRFLLCRASTLSTEKRCKRKIDHGEHHSEYQANQNTRD